MQFRTVLKYAIAGFAVFWTVVAEVTVLLFIYEILRTLFPEIPLIEPLHAIAIALALLGFTSLAGYYRFGNLAQFIVWSAKWADHVLGWSIFEDPLVEGRLMYDDVAWRLTYSSGAQTEIEGRECPLCGLSLVEAYLPRHIVHGPNSGFNPPEAKRKVAAEAWHDVLGKEKIEDREETQALTCPDCEFAIPGNPEVIEGRDAVIAKFERHLERMKAHNPSKSPFKSYAKQARERYGRDPKPGEVWDEYVRESDDEDLLYVAYDVGPETSDPQSKTNESSVEVASQ